MNRFVNSLIFLILLTSSVIAQNDLHQWYERNNLGITFNEDRSNVLIVGFDRITLWNTADGKLLQSAPLPPQDGKVIVDSEFEFIGAAPDLSEFIYLANGTYQRYMMDIDDIDLFPDFQNRRVKQILGYDSQGWMVFFSEGFYQGFYRVKQDGNTSFVEFLSMEYINKASMSNDHKYVLFTRDNTFRYLNIETKEVTDTKLPSAYWRDNHLPPGQLTLYNWNSKNKKGSEVEWRYFIELGKPLGRKLTGKNAQGNFQYKDFCADFPSFVFGNTGEDHWVMKHSNRDGDRAKFAYQYVLIRENHSDCQELGRISFTESVEENQKRKLQKRDEYDIAQKQQKANAEAMKPSWFQEYITKFVQLPSTYTFDYDTAKGVDVSQLAFVQNEKYRTGNPTEYAIGKLMTCSNGNVIVLRVSKRLSGTLDHQNFHIITYDSQGNQLDFKKIAETQKINNQFPVVSFFTITSSGDQWTANVNMEHRTTNRTSSEKHSGNCR